MTRFFLCLRRVIRSGVTVILIGLVLALSIAGTIFIFGKIDPGKKAELWIEVGKALIQLAAVVIAGTVVAKLFQSFSKGKRTDAALHEFRMEFLEGLSTAYRNVKKIRRKLRTLGLTVKALNPPKSFPRQVVASYVEQMDLLNDTQLDIERLKLELGHFPDSFFNAESISLSLHKMEHYLNDGIAEFEENAFQLSKSPEDVLFEHMKWLIDFTGHFHASLFACEFASRYAIALAAVREELLPLKVVLDARFSDGKEE